MHQQPSERMDHHEHVTPANSPARDPLRKAEDIFHHGPIAEQLEQQISLLTQAMAESMIYASGAFPDLTEGEIPEMENGYGFSVPVAPKRATAWSAARSLQLHDAARLSFATASLVGALTKLKSQPGQRFTTRQTWIPDSDEKKKPRKVTTFTHTLIAPREVAGMAHEVAESSISAAPSEAAQ